MKKATFLFSGIFLIASCTLTPQQKAESLIKEHLEKSLYHPESYVPSSTQLDSAFTPYDDPDFYEKALKAAKLGIKISQCDDNANDAKRNMALWSGPYQSSYDRQNYIEEKEKFNKAIKNKELATKEMKALAEEMKAIANQGKKFIGFKAIHNYRANNNAGQTIGGNIQYNFDKDLSKIINFYDMQSEEYQAVSYIYKMMKGEISAADDVNLDNQTSERI